MNTKMPVYNDKYIDKFCTKYIWFSSLLGDLIFLAIIDTLFMTMVKGLSAAQITLQGTISAAVAIVIQPYILKIIHKIGNTASIRAGALFLLISCILITIGPNNAILILGTIFYEIGFVFKNMEGIMLKNNLIYAKRENEYIHIRNKATIVYSVITAIVAFTSGFLFNINSYMPMILNILLCVFCFVLSLSMKDITKYDKIPEKEIKKSTQKMSMIVYVAIISYAFFYTTIKIGQSNGKLFIQYQLNENFDIQLTATYLSIIVSISRIARIVANLLFDRIYMKLKDKINIALSLALISAFVFIIMGDFIKYNIILKISLMALGFFIILSVRDPFKIYIQDLILRVTSPDEQQTIFAHLELARKIGSTLLGFVVSAALLKVSMIWIIVGAAVISLMTLKTTIRLFELVKRISKVTKASQNIIE